MDAFNSILLILVKSVVHILVIVYMLIRSSTLLKLNYWK
jgi:hypothetical protein